MQEAELTFRTQMKPLDSILLLPISPPSSASQADVNRKNTASSLFVCVKHGKFHISALPSLEAAPAVKAIPVKPNRSIGKKVKLVLTGILLLALPTITIVICLAEYFPSVNAFILRLLPIDIRAEIAYLLHLIQRHL